MLIGNMSTGETSQQMTVCGGDYSPMSSDFSGDGGVFEPDFELTPLIKEELRTTIRNRRINSGKSDDLSYDDTPKPQYELTMEEKRKRQLRRDRNRIAATKCRMKRKQEVTGLAVESERLQSTNEQLQDEIQRLKEERKTILELINSHRPSCIMGPISVPNAQDAPTQAVSFHSDR